jgi:hypothetical protein
MGKSFSFLNVFLEVFFRRPTMRHLFCLNEYKMLE